MEEQVFNLIDWWIVREKTISRDHYDEFLRFFIYYMCFDAWITSESGEDSDNKKIKWLISDGGVLKQVFDNKGFDRSDLNALKKLSPIEDMRPKHRGETVNLNDVNDFEEVVWFVYKIRCNLFHGGKNPTNGRDSNLVSFAGNFLGKWIRWAHLSTK
jgi:hypothetical protein